MAVVESKRCLRMCLTMPLLLASARQAASRPQAGGGRQGSSAPSAFGGSHSSAASSLLGERSVTAKHIFACMLCLLYSPNSISLHQLDFSVISGVVCGRQVTRQEIHSAWSNHLTVIALPKKVAGPLLITLSARTTTRLGCRPSPLVLLFCCFFFNHTRCLAQSQRTTLSRSRIPRENHSLLLS